MAKHKKEQLDRHIKTHSKPSNDDRNAVSMLQYFLKSDGKINHNFSYDDKRPNIDGTIELVPEPEICRRPKQNFIVQIKGTKNYKVTEDDGIKYHLKSLAFPAYIAREVTLDPGILFVVLNAGKRGEERVFWKYISPKFLSWINFENNSATIIFSTDDEIKNTDESINKFAEKLIEISENHSFMKQLEIREYDNDDAIKIISRRSENICDAIDEGTLLNYNRDNVSRKILTELEDLCNGTLILNGLRFDESINLRNSWGIALESIETKFLATFLYSLRYIGLRVPEDGQHERLMLKYYNFLWMIREYLNNSHGIETLSNLEKFPREENREDKEYNEMIATSINATKNRPNAWRSSRYYIQKKTPFYVGANRYFEITLQLAGKYATKFNRLTVYTKINISSNYSIQIDFEEVDITLWDNPSKIKVVTNWRVSVEPSVLNDLASIIGKETKLSSKYGEYQALMEFLTKTGINLLDFIDVRKERFDYFIEKIYKEQNTSYFKKVLVDLQNRFNVNSKEYGKNTVRYLLLRLREEAIEGLLLAEGGKRLSNNLCLSSGCVPFENNPSIYNLPKQKTNNKSINNDVFRAVGSKNLEKYLPYIRTRNLINGTGEIYFERNQIEFAEIGQTIEEYNAGLSDWDRAQRVELIEEDGYIYIDNYVKNTVSILKDLLKFSESGNDGQKQLNESFLKNIDENLIDVSKRMAIGNAFVDSRVLMIYGAAGTGKTTLMNFISKLMEGRSKLFLTKTHTALENLKRRIDSPGQNSQFMGVDKFIRSINSIDYDLIFIDECSTIDNRTMVELLKKISEGSLLILAGDIYQIESIDFGNWFFYSQNILPEKAITELNSTWRTQQEAIKSLWEEVRFKKPLVTEKLVIDGPFSENISKSVFERADDDEVVLCLNYDGKFGLNSINGYFQDANNLEKFYVWHEWKYKVGDPVLFTESKRFPKLYNNLKGKIIEIQSDERSIHFTIDIDIILTEIDVKGCDFKRISTTNKSTRISFVVYENDGGTTDGERETARMNSIVPFQLAYAVSIHKAQGLEYNSIKIVIPNSNSEKISHGVFYTAITRTKEKLKIYWSADTMKKVINSFYDTKKEIRSLELIKKKCQESLTQ